VNEKRILRRIIESNRKEVIGGWRKLNNEELHNVYSSPNTIRVIKWRRMRWVGRVTRTGEIRVRTKF
jgi:hypothetical protein